MIAKMKRVAALGALAIGALLSLGLAGCEPLGPGGGRPPAPPIAPPPPPPG
jgi:hypothetical protein